MPFLHTNQDLKTTPIKSNFCTTLTYFQIGISNLWQESHPFSGASVFPETLTFKMQVCVADEKKKKKYSKHCQSPLDSSLPLLTFLTAGALASFQ